MAVSRGKHYKKLRTMVMAIAGDDLRIGTVFWFAGDKSKGIYEVLEDGNSGGAIGGFLETAVFIDMLEVVKRGEPIKLEPATDEELQEVMSDGQVH